MSLKKDREVCGSNGLRKLSPMEFKIILISFHYTQLIFKKQLCN